MIIKYSDSVSNLTYIGDFLLGSMAPIDKQIVDITRDRSTYWREERWTVLDF